MPIKKPEEHAFYLLLKSSLRLRDQYNQSGKMMRYNGYDAVMRLSAKEIQALPHHPDHQNLISALNDLARHYGRILPVTDCISELVDKIRQRNPEFADVYLMPALQTTIGAVANRTYNKGFESKLSEFLRSPRVSELTRDEWALLADLNSAAMTLWHEPQFWPRPAAAGTTADVLKALPTQPVPVKPNTAPMVTPPPTLHGSHHRLHHVDTKASAVKSGIPKCATQVMTLDAELAAKLAARRALSAAESKSSEDSSVAAVGVR